MDDPTTLTKKDAVLGYYDSLEEVLTEDSAGRLVEFCNESSERFQAAGLTIVESAEAAIMLAAMSMLCFKTLYEEDGFQFDDGVLESFAAEVCGSRVRQYLHLLDGRVELTKLGGVH